MEAIELLTKYKNKTVSLLVVLLAVIISFNIFAGQNKEIASLKNKQDEEARKNEIAAELGQLDKKINAYRDTLSNKDANSLINIISALARDSGVTVISVKPEDQMNYPEYSKLPLVVSVKTQSYHSLGSFISSLESRQDVYIVDAAEVKADSKTQEITARFKVSGVIAGR